MGELRNNMIRHMRFRGYAEKSIKLYTSCIGTLARHFGASPLSLGRADIESFFLHLRSRGISDATIRAYYEGMKFFYRMHGLSDRLPHMRFPRANKTIPALLGQEDVRSLLEGCRSLRFKTLFTLIYSAGLRVSEAANLSVSDIDFKRNVILVRNGKNGKDRYTLLVDRAREMLGTYLDLYRPSSYLFYRTGECTEHISVSAIQRTFKELARSVGLSEAVHVHTLRHCFATHLLENGTSIFYIMHLLGHAHIQTTMAYLHMRDLSELKITSPADLLARPEPRETAAPGELFRASA